MLSIIIPTYNEEEYLPCLLRSIAAQTFRDLEVIVADAKSTDRTRDIAKEFGATIIDGGMPAVGRNRGAAVARGDILLFFDADVVLPDPWFLQMTVAEFEKRHLGAATCSIQPLSKKPVDKVFHVAFNYYMWVTQATTPHAPGFCIFARKSVHDAILGFDEEIKLAEDHDYVVRAAKIAKFGILKSYKIPVSVRRFDRDGRLNVAMKYLLSELYLRTKGNIKSDIFNYTFGYPKDKSKPSRARTAFRWRRQGGKK